MTTLTTAEVAAQFKCHRRWVYDRLADGSLVGEYIAGRWLITQAAVDTFRAARRNKPAAKAARRRPRRLS